MKDFKELKKIVDDLDEKDIWAYMLEIATVIDEASLTDEQKEDAYAIASVEFEESEDCATGANVYAEAAIETVLDEKYDGNDMKAVNSLFNEKLDGLLN